MNTLPAYYVGTHPNSFRSGEASLIVGVVFCQPEGGPWRPCYEVEFEDGRRDWFPISDHANYIITNAVRRKMVKL